MANIVISSPLVKAALQSNLHPASILLIKHLPLISTAVNTIEEKEEATEENGNCRNAKYPIQ